MTILKYGTSIYMEKLIKHNGNYEKNSLHYKRSLPIFIGRQSKSGGSLLRTLIGKHNNIFGGDGFETGWFTDDINANWKDDNTLRQNHHQALIFLINL